MEKTVNERIREQIQKIRDIDWGWDGDCGVGDYIDKIEEILDETEKE